MCNPRESSFTVGRSHALCFQVSDDMVKSPSVSQIHVVTVPSDIPSLREERSVRGRLVVTMIAMIVS